MTKIEVEQLINQFIITNGNKEITAAILNPILNAILTQPNDLIGVLENSNVVGNTVVDKLNTLLSAINSISTIKIINGENNPNITPPLSYNLGDFYNLTIAGVTQNFYQYNGVNWVEVGNVINDLGTNATQTWSSQKIANMINQKDEFTYVSSLSIDNNVVTIGAGTKWRINGVMYENINAVSLTAPYSGVGLSRIDNILGNTSNTFELQQGIQTNGIAFPPTKPANKVILRELLVTEFNINSDNTIYKEKSESNIIQVTNPGLINSYELNSDASIIELTAANQLNSFNFTTDSKQYNGKTYTIVNKSSVNITLGYNAGNGSIKLSFPSAANYILKPKEVVTFYFSENNSLFNFQTTNIATATSIRYISYMQWLYSRETLTATNTWKTWASAYNGLTQSFWGNVPEANMGTADLPTISNSAYGISTNKDLFTKLDHLIWQDSHAAAYSKRVLIYKADVPVNNPGALPVNHRIISNVLVNNIANEANCTKIVVNDLDDTPTGYHSIYTMYVKDISYSGAGFSTRTITWNFIAK